MPFVLDLLRHGAALPAAEGGDGARRLSPAGRRVLERLAERLVGLGWHPDRVFTSPLVRARDSARILLDRTAPELIPEVMEALGPGGETSDVLEALSAGRVSRGHVLLVGHQPLLGLLAGVLTAGTSPGFAPGTLVRIEFPDGPAAGGGALRPVGHDADLRTPPSAHPRRSSTQEKP